MVPRKKGRKTREDGGSKERLNFTIGVTPYDFVISVQNVKYFVCTINPIKIFSSQNQSQLFLLR